MYAREFGIKLLQYIEFNDRLVLPLFHGFIFRMMDDALGDQLSRALVRFEDQEQHCRVSTPDDVGNADVLNGLALQAREMSSQRRAEFREEVLRAVRRRQGRVTFQHVHAWISFKGSVASRRSSGFGRLSAELRGGRALSPTSASQRGRK